MSKNNKTVEKLTKKKKEELINKYHHLLNNVLPTIRNNVNEYRKQGDLSENAEYQSEIRKLNKYESEASDLFSLISYAEVIDNSDFANNGTQSFCISVALGTCCELENNQQEKITYSIVGANETDPENNKISYRAPFAQKLIGKKIGDLIEIGSEVYKIIKIYYL